MPKHPAYLVGQDSRLVIASTPCRLCGEPTEYTGTRLCDPCWNVTELDYLARLAGVPLGIFAFFRWVLEVAGENDAHESAWEDATYLYAREGA